MPSQIEKLQAHASHLLDAFIRLRERYAMLAPMLFQEAVVQTHGSRHQARGFEILRNSLFLSCAQDIAKLSHDDDKRTPSIHNLVHALTDPNVRTELRDRFSLWHIPSRENETDSEIVAALKRIELREQTVRRAQFDEMCCETTEARSKLSTSPALKAFLTIRDKISAHTEVQFVADKYQFVDIGSLGIKWGNMGEIIDVMQRLVEMLGLLIRNAGFAWDMLDEQLSQAASTFWIPANAAR